jgi:hypothetical protein
MKETRNKNHKKKLPRRRKTLKCNSSSNKQKARIVVLFLEMMDTVKLYHWKTKSYSEHEASDMLHENLEGSTDKFIEVLQGKCSQRINLVNNRIKLIDIQDSDSLKEKIFEYRSFLIDLDIFLHPKKDSDLMSIRDDILASINQFLYLLSFDK